MLDAPAREPHSVPCPANPAAAWCIAMSGNVVHGWPTFSFSKESKLRYAPVPQPPPSR